MLINIKTSEKNKTLVSELTRKFNFPSENHIARIAFAYTIYKNLRFDLEKDTDDSKGKEYKDDILLGKYREIYLAVICQYYNIKKDDDKISKYFKVHIDKGLELLNDFLEKNPNYAAIEFIMEVITKSLNILQYTQDTNSSVENVNINIETTEFNNELIINVGTKINSDEQVLFRLNNLTLHNNAHIAIAGNTGTGKTRFALHLLSQVHKISEGKTRFIYLDFKGLNKNDQQKLAKFFNETDTKLINCPDESFPVNPLTFIDLVNEKNKIIGINKLTDIITSHAKLGKVQKSKLKNAIESAFSDVKGGFFPSFKDIYNKFIEEDFTEDSLYEFLKSMSEFEIFSNNKETYSSFFRENYYFSLGGNLPSNLRLTAVFLTINYIYNTFMNLSDSSIDNDIQSLRYFLVIDEAHVIFKDRKSQEMLESILREIRSKGVSVVLVSQGIEEYNQPNFDFSTMCENIFLLDIKDKGNLKLILKFLGLGEKYQSKVSTAFSKIQRGECISNIKELNSIELFNLIQY